MPLTNALNLAREHHQAGRLPQAEALYRQALPAEPRNAEIFDGLGQVLLTTGRFAEAESCFGNALSLRPDIPHLHTLMGVALSSQGKLAEALQSHRSAVARQPRVPEALAHLAAAQAAVGQYDDAIASYRRALAIRPQFAEVQSNLGNVLSLAGKNEEAVSAYRAAVSHKPQFAEAWVNLGIVLRALGRREESASAFHQAITLRPQLVDAHFNLGAVLVDLKQPDAALEHLRIALSLRPNHPDSLMAVGLAFYAKGMNTDAIAVYRRAIELKPDFTEAYLNLGVALGAINRADESQAALEQALRLKPDLPEAHLNLATVLRDKGLIDEAIERYRSLVALRPTPTNLDALLYTLHFHPDYTPARIRAEHAAYDAVVRIPSDPASHANDRTSNRRLRVGYVSPDFRDHCQANFLLPLLANHDKSRFEIFAYGNMPSVDAVGERLLTHVEHRRSIAGIGDAQADAMIRADGIDILVDLTLHMADNRLPLFARKPAPVQMTWLGYPSTTGVSAIAYRLSDSYLDPPGETDAFYIEKTIRLPDTFWCYDPMSDLPANAAPPAERAGYITFGCLNNFAKVTDATLNLWGRVMQSVPNSRLILLTPFGSARTRVVNALAMCAVAADRVTFVERLPRREYLLTYQQIDIGIDTVPYAGHTTTLDALWMATPVVTCTGSTAVSRGAASILHCVGLDELITHNADDFVKCAVDLANNTLRLCELRSDLRSRFERSPLADAKRFTKNMEAVFEQVWAAWIAHSQS
jgi:protein O-GlcNAc transferase